MVRTTVLVRLFSTAALVLIARAVAAQECPATCNLRARSCLAEARVAMRTCTLGCRGDREHAGQCLQSCFGAFLPAKGACRSDQGSCLQGCSPQPPPDAPAPSCRGACGMKLSTCLRGLALDARRCVRSCLTAADRPACHAACATVARAGSAACHGNYDACATQCGDSASGAFVRPAPLDHGSPA
jgi:hypothetical protein